MQKSESIADLATALVKAQTAFDAIKRDKTVTVRTKTGGSYTFAYAPLDTILAAIRPHLADNGLALIQGCHVENGQQVLRTMLLHSSGQFIANDTSVLVNDSGPQAYGSALSYAARYGVTRLLCLASEDDDDGNGAEGNDAAFKKRNAQELISETQAMDLEAWTSSLGIDMKQFCKFLNVAKISDLPAARYEAAKTALENKQKALAKSKLESANV